LLDENETENWRTVRDDYFAPLAALQSADWDEKLKPYLDRVRADEIKAGLDKKTLRRGGKKLATNAEIERVLSRAKHEEEVGDLVGAEHTLSDLALILADNPQLETELKVVQDSLDELLRKHIDQPADLSFVATALDRAESLAKEGKSDEAARIRQGIINLYANDPQAAPLVERAKRQLGTASAHTATGKSTP
jgi:hypothetical protein